MTALAARRANKRVAVVQPAYLPWRGYFDIIASVDLFIVYDDVQYSRGTWQNRNQLKTAEGLKWLTVPVSSKLTMAIDQVPIAWHAQANWLARHERLIESALSPAPHGAEAIELWKEGVKEAGELLSPLNVRLIRLVCEYLGVKTQLLHSRSFSLSGRKTERLLDLLAQVEASHYVSGPLAKAYLDHDAFRERGIGLEYKSYDYAPYPQSWGPFLGNVSVLDLIANTGTGAREHLSSRSPNEIVVACA